MKKLNIIGVQLAIVSFIFGTLLFLAFIITQESTIISYGYLYLLCALFINSLLAIVLLLLAIVFKSERIKNIKTIGFMLLNIPISFLYTILVINY